MVRNPVGPSVSFTRFYTSATARFVASTPTSETGLWHQNDSGDFLGENGPYSPPPPPASTDYYETIELPTKGSAGFSIGSMGWTHEYDVTILFPAYYSGNNPPNTIPKVLKIHSPDGSTDTLTAELNGQGQPTGKLTPAPGAPYVASGTYDPSY